MSNQGRPDPCNWTCQVGELPSVELDAHGGGMDDPMRQAVIRAYRLVAGRNPDYLFSGWGGPLAERERAAHENRTPDPLVTARELALQLSFLPRGERDDLDALVDAARTFLKGTG
jgi:hypothetical protein